LPSSDSRYTRKVGRLPGSFGSASCDWRAGDELKAAGIRLDLSIVAYNLARFEQSRQLLDDAVRSLEQLTPGEELARASVEMAAELAIRANAEESIRWAGCGSGSRTSWGWRRRFKARSAFEGWRVLASGIEVARRTCGKPSLGKAMSPSFLG
jgi:hypothetical protein